MEMPKVEECNMESCSYNIGKTCHAMAITVGKNTPTRCDTYCQAEIKGGDLSSTAKVGACKVRECNFNNSLECQASKVKIGVCEGHTYCLTFTPKEKKNNHNFKAGILKNLL